jgi:hypothetical protein
MKKGVMGILSLILVALTFAGGLYFGGSGTETVPCMNGGKCEVKWNTGGGIEGAVKDCKFKALGDKCKFTFEAEAEYTEEGVNDTVPVKEIPESPGVTPDQKTGTDNKIDSSNKKSPEQNKAVIPEETKAIIPDEEKEVTPVEKEKVIPESPKEAKEVPHGKNITVIVPKNASGLPRHIR